MTYIVACNLCGSGKKLYFKRYNPLMKDGEEPFVWVEYERDQMKTTVKDLEKGCPSCGCKDLEIIKVG